VFGRDLDPTVTGSAVAMRILPGASMQTFAPLLAFTAAATLLTITPGLDTAMVLRNAGRGGPRRGGAAALGIALGCVLWGVGAAYGLTALLPTSELAFTAVKWAGAAYLFWMGLGLVLGRRPVAALVPSEPAPAAVDEGAEAFRRGLLTNLMNPKVGIFYITFLPLFIPRGADVATFALLLTVIHVTISLAWFALLIALTAPLGRWLMRPRVSAWLDRATGLVFIGFGARLLLTDRR
jgi:threonine/homoserine/homoserine lactone efflux protein